MPNKKKGELRDQWISIRVSEEEKEKLQEIAGYEERDLSNFVRTSALQKIKPKR